MQLIPKGVYILCNKCGNKMNPKTGLCTKCENAKCVIELYWRQPEEEKGKYYRYRRDDKGKVFWYVTAIEKAVAIGGTLAKGTFNPVAFTDEAIKERRFENQFEAYRAEMEKQKDSGEWSIEHFRHLESYSRLWFEWLNGRDVKDINHEVLKQFKTTLAGKSKTKKNILKMLHAFFAWLYDRGTIPLVPAFPEVKGGDETRRKALRRSEQIQALSGIPEEHRDIIQFMMMTGCRPSEAVAILVESIDIGNRLIWIERVKDSNRELERTKNRESLPVPLNDTALDIVTRNMKGRFPSQHLFINPNTGKSYTQWCIWDNWKRFSGTDVTPYEATRHSFCSQISGKVSSPRGQRLMRHRSAQSTNRYYHEWSEELVDAVQSIDNVIPLRQEKQGNED